MNVVDRGRYVSSILMASTLGIVATVAADQFIGQRTISWVALWSAISNLHMSKTGLSQIWSLAASGGLFAAAWVWSFETFVWKWPWLHGWFVRFPNLSGTWLGILEPRADSMLSVTPDLSLNTDELHRPHNSLIPVWAQEKRVLPVRVVIEQEFHRLVFKAFHPNSQNTTLAQQLVYDAVGKNTRLYVVYSEQYDHGQMNAAAHEGCCELELTTVDGGKSPTHQWRLLGQYWTNKPRTNSASDDRGTWGYFDIWLESEEEVSIAWEDEAKFCRTGAQSS